VPRLGSTPAAQGSHFRLPRRIPIEVPGRAERAATRRTPQPGNPSNLTTPVSRSQPPRKQQPPATRTRDPDQIAPAHEHTPAESGRLTCLQRRRRGPATAPPGRLPAQWCEDDELARSLADAPLPSPHGGGDENERVPTPPHTGAAAARRKSKAAEIRFEFDSLRRRPGRSLRRRCAAGVIRERGATNRGRCLPSPPLPSPPRRVLNRSASSSSGVTHASKQPSAPARGGGIKPHVPTFFLRPVLIDLKKNSSPSS
jgi:hypothetical protein